jgi:ABC-2 type transport system ATP-binding protein
MSAIAAENLTRTYNGTTAVDGISFNVDQGEIFGFLGPNGAGKTTTIRMLTGQTRPTSGFAQVAGHDVVTEPQSLKRHIGVVFEHQNLYERLSARDNLAFWARLYGVPFSRIDAVLDWVQLTDRAKDKVEKYSNGMKQRLLIARALLHEPRVLFLDEPTRGLDPNIAQTIRNVISELGKRGTTVFLTTHYMEEADQLCDRVAIVDKGRILALDTSDKLKLAHGTRLVCIQMQDGSLIELSLDDPNDGRRMGELAASGRIATMHSSEATLEQVFMSLTGKEALA